MTSLVSNARVGRDTFEQRTHTRCLVEFHSDQNPGGEMIQIGSKAGSFDKRFGHLVGVTTHKGFDSTSGNFTINIKKPKVRAKSLVRLWTEPEDVWVKIFWVVDGQPIHTMTGLIDTINESTVRSGGGKRVEGYTITGRDVGKIFETTELWLNVYELGDGLVKSYAQYLNLLKDEAEAISGGSPEIWIKMLLEVWLGNNGAAEHQWEMPDSLGSNSFFELLNTGTIQRMNAGHGGLADATIFEIDMDQGFGKLWEVLQRYSNDFLNEMWIDLDSKEVNGEFRPALYLRQRPFPTAFGSDRWDAIKKHMLNRQDVSGRSVSKGGSANRYNFWLLKLDGKIGANERALIQSGRIDEAEQGRPGGIPIWNAESIVKHGLRRWERSTQFLSTLTIDPAKSSFWYQVAANWLRRVHDWYAVAPMQLSGTLNCSRLFPEIRIGQRIQEARNEGDIIYYVEGVDHEWQYPGMGKTNLTVTRGEYIDEDLLAIIYDQLENPKVPVNFDSCFFDDPLLDAIFQDCKFEPIPGNDVLLDDDWDASTDALVNTTDPFLVKSALVGEGGEGFSVKGELENEDPEMIPPDDAEQDQANQLATINPNAKLRKPPGRDFDQNALERGDDPLKGFDDFVANDPLAGLGELPGPSG